MEEAEAPSSHFAVFSVLSQVLEKDEISAQEFEEKDRPKDDYIDHELLREWFRKRLKVADEHKMSLREIWRNFCYEYQIYCSLPLFGNVVLRHVLQANSKWKGVTKVGDIKQKRYNLAWISDPPGTEEQIDAFFARIKEKVDRAPRAHPNGNGSSAIPMSELSSVPPTLNSNSPSGNVLINNSPSNGVNVTSSLGGGMRHISISPSAAIEVPRPATSPPLSSSFGSSPFGDGDLSPDEGSSSSGSGVFGRNNNVPQVFLDPSLLAEWWTRRLEPTDPGACRMRMRDIYERFVLETGVAMPKALFGELSVRYVLSTGPFAQVVRKGKIHSKRYSLQWRNEPFTASSSSGPSLSTPIPSSSSAPLLNGHPHLHHHHSVPPQSLPTPIPQVNSTGNAYAGHRSGAGAGGGGGHHYVYDQPSSHRGSPPVRPQHGSNANSPSSNGFSSSFSLYHQHQQQYPSPIGRPGYAAAVLGNTDTTQKKKPIPSSASLPAQPPSSQWPPPPQQPATQPKTHSAHSAAQTVAVAVAASSDASATTPVVSKDRREEEEDEDGGGADSYSLNHYRSPNVLAQCTA